MVTIIIIIIIVIIFIVIIIIIIIIIINIMIISYHIISLPSAVLACERQTFLLAPRRLGRRNVYRSQATAVFTAQRLVGQALH